MKPTSVLEKYPAYQVDIGIEVHVQLNTNSKIFCSSQPGSGEMPNEHIDLVCAGYPGVLPVLNKRVVDYAIMAGLATHCSINQDNEFARKHYFYPDLPKGYQISQHNLPICVDGYIDIRLPDGTDKRIRIQRIHMEEDAGKNIHAANGTTSLVDLNRAGSPLLEIVSHPDIKSADEARAYLKALRTIVVTLGICSGNMEDGAFRADTNLSVRKKGDPKLGTRCELKNINSFKFIADAIEYEIERQIQLIESGGSVVQQTRLWDTSAKKTYPMREKEEAADYRYFTDPDLPALHIDDGWIQSIKDTMPELPEAKMLRLQEHYAMKYDDAEILVQDMALCAYYEKAAATHKSPQLVHWILRDIGAWAKDTNRPVEECPVEAHAIAQIVQLLDTNTINAAGAKKLFAHILEHGGAVTELVASLGLTQVTDLSALQNIAQAIIAANPGQVADYKSGKTKLMGFFVGQAMKESKGAGNPQILQEIFTTLLS